MGFVFNEAIFHFHSCSLCCCFINLHYMFELLFFKVCFFPFVINYSRGRPMLNEVFSGMLDASWVGEPVISPWLDSAAMTGFPQNKTSQRDCPNRGATVLLTFSSTKEGALDLTFWGNVGCLLVPLGLWGSPKSWSENDNDTKETKETFLDCFLGFVKMFQWLNTAHLEETICMEIRKLCYFLIGTFSPIWLDFCRFLLLLDWVEVGWFVFLLGGMEAYSTGSLFW